MFSFFHIFFIFFHEYVLELRSIIGTARFTGSLVGSFTSLEKVTTSLTPNFGMEHTNLAAIQTTNNFKSQLGLVDTPFLTLMDIFGLSKWLLHDRLMRSHISIYFEYCILIHMFIGYFFKTFNLFLKT